MTRRAIALAGCVAVALGALPAPARAGGMSFPPRSFPANPGLRPTSPFGSPGGFPFKAIQDHRGRVPVPARRFPRTTFFPAFPAFPLYASIPYSYSTDTSAPTVNVSPEIYVSPTVYVSVPAAIPQPAPVVTAAVAPSLPSVVEFPTGRYELRGDGLGVPYAWVWIPNPPSAPPLSATAREDTLPATSASASRSQVYRWTDKQGTEFWTNQPDKVPAPYRSNAEGLRQAASQP